MRVEFLYVQKSEDIKERLLLNTGSVPQRKKPEGRKTVFYEKKVFSEFTYVGDCCRMLNHVLCILGCYLRLGS